MAILGHVTSTALTGGDSPVFEKAGVAAVEIVGQKTDSLHAKMEAQDKQIASLTAALTAFLASQTAPAESVEPAAPSEPELTPAEKAALTKAANKAKAESE